ncbi:esc1 [Hyphodiscus hymeniophilus]|uniref:Esc1 n=1 Tax=Hyphodiscus hymeniophilus TaxID=353542 RepID=A0A9P6VHW1_9HELO|nr:esc1 [Hyphodiscus hymeniophilus]
MEHPASQHKLPAGLAGVLNHPEDQRDSAYFSIQDPSSKHTSTQSSNGVHVPTPPSSYPSSILDKTPSPIVTNHYAQPLSSPTGGMSVASMVSPTSIDGQSIHNRFSRPSYEAGPMSAGLSTNGEDSSRRQSMSSTLGINDLTLTNSRSPYASNNQSTTSIQSTLQQQRNPGAHQDRNSVARLSNSYAPHSQRLPDALPSGRHIGGAAPKTAPTITGPALGNIARAPEPTKGQAWAFPEEEVQRLPSAARPSDETSSRHQSYLDSRRSSMADSIASSQFTTESRLPPGQRRLEDGMPSDYPRASRELQTHHHSLAASKHILDLRNSEGDSPTGTQPYSRTPELRVSHKLAERKRRTEMKDLFDTLRDLMPQERGSKASKWEILTKAISEHQRLLRDVSEQRQHTAAVSEQAETSRREANTLRLENTQLRHELGRLSGFQPSSDQRINTTPHKGAELPPIRGSFIAEDNMTGVQYNEVPPMHMASQHRPQPQVECRSSGFPFQGEQSRVGSMYPDPTHNGYHPPQVNGYHHSEQPRSNGLKF